MLSKNRLLDRSVRDRCCWSHAKCLKTMAKQIADRDNSVRDAALTETYFQEGEKLYKMVGNLPENVSYSR